MKWSFHITTIAGTQVRIHATFALLLAFVGWQAMGAGGNVHGALHAMLLVCTMFFCVLLHEFGHVIAARKYGILTPDITLLPIGGVARMQRMPRKPSEEFVVAVCGPLVNVIIASVISIVLGMPLLSHASSAHFMEPGHFWESLMHWNLVMVFFNLVPAFPMDGGRVLRALLAMITSDYAKATRWAATIGQALAVVVVMSMVVSGALQPMLLLIAFFIFFAAGQEAAMVNEQEAAVDLKVRDAMLTEYHTLPANAVLRQAVELLLASAQHDFPVLDVDGEMLGVLSRRRLIGALAEHGPGCPVEMLIERTEESLDPSQDLVSAMEKFATTGCSAMPVVDPVSQKMIGLLTAENVGETLLVREAMRRKLVA